MKIRLLALLFAVVFTACSFEERQAAIFTDAGRQQDSGDINRLDAAAADANDDSCLPFLLEPDEFEDGVRNSQWVLYEAGTGVVTESEGQLNVSLGEGPGGRLAGYRSARSNLSLVSHRISIRVTSLVSESRDSHVYLDFGGDPSNVYYVRVVNDQVTLYFRDQDLNVEVVGNTTYDPIEHQYFQFREKGGRFYFETASADGNWVFQASDVLNTASKLAAVESGAFKFYGRNVSLEPDVSTISFDEFNSREDCVR